MPECLARSLLPAPCTRDSTHHLLSSPLVFNSCQTEHLLPAFKQMLLTHAQHEKQNFPRCVAHKLFFPTLVSCFAKKDSR